MNKSIANCGVSRCAARQSLSLRTHAKYARLLLQGCPKSDAQKTSRNIIHPPAERSSSTGSCSHSATHSTMTTSGRAWSTQCAHVKQTTADASTHFSCAPNLENPTHVTPATSSHSAPARLGGSRRQLRLHLMHHAESRNTAPESMSFTSSKKRRPAQSMSTRFAAAPPVQFRSSAFNRLWWRPCRP